MLWDHEIMKFLRVWIARAVLTSQQLTPDRKYLPWWFGWQKAENIFPSTFLKWNKIKIKKTKNHYLQARQQKPLNKEKETSSTWTAPPTLAWSTYFTCQPLLLSIVSAPGLLSFPVKSSAPEMIPSTCVQQRASCFCQTLVDWCLHWKGLQQWRKSCWKQEFYFGDELWHPEIIPGSSSGMMTKQLGRLRLNYHSLGYTVYLLHYPCGWSCAWLIPRKDELAGRGAMEIGWFCLGSKECID